MRIERRRYRDGGETVHLFTEGGEEILPLSVQIIDASANQVRHAIVALPFDEIKTVDVDSPVRVMT